jgi:hypothetical protein
LPRCFFRFPSKFWICGSRHVRTRCRGWGLEMKSILRIPPHWRGLALPEYERLVCNRRSQLSEFRFLPNASVTFIAVTFCDASKRLQMFSEILHGAVRLAWLPLVVFDPVTSTPSSKNSPKAGAMQGNRETGNSRMSHGTMAGKLAWTMASEISEEEPRGCETSSS